MTILTYHRSAISIATQSARQLRQSEAYNYRLVSLLLQKGNYNLHFALKKITWTKPRGRVEAGEGGGFGRVVGRGGEKMQATVIEQQ